MPSTRLPKRAYWSVYAVCHYLGQARYPFRSTERIARDRDRRVRRMVAYAYRWVPYYRETLDRLGLAPDDFHCFADLSRLPLISVADLQADPSRFRSQQFDLDELLPLSSSGSTGRPHTVWHDLGSLYQNIGHAEREQVMWRQALGKRRLRKLSIGSAMSSAEPVRKATRANALWPGWLARVGQPLDTSTPPDSWAEEIIARQPDMLTAYGATVNQLVAFCRATGAELRWPPVVRYAAAGLPEPARHWLQETQGVQVFSGYQAIEAFKMGFECTQHDGYHVNEDIYPLRIVDEQGHDCAPGERGEVVISNLVNRGTVLLNYRMGDLAASLAEPCPCGRHLPRISFVQGRTRDVLCDTQGNRHSHMLLAAPISKAPGVLEWQVRQTALDRIIVQLVVAPGCNREELAQCLAAVGRDKLGASMRVEVEYVERIERTAAGKLRACINEVLTLP